MKKPTTKKWVKLVLDSTYVRHLNSYGVLKDGNGGTTGNYVWNSLVYELEQLLPPQRIAEMLKATSYEFKLDSLVWSNRTKLDDLPFKFDLPNVTSDNVYSNRARNTEGTLAIVYKTYSPLVNYRPGSEHVGFVTTSRNWLMARQLWLKFTKLDGTEFANWAFGADAAATDTTTSYVATIVIEYDVEE